MGMQSAQVGAPMSQNQPSGKGGSAPTFQQTQGEPELGPENQPYQRDVALPATFPAYRPAQNVRDEMGNPVGPLVSAPMTQQPMGKGGNVTFPGQGGQPRFGRPNNYSNTVGPWDNASIQPRQTQSGKGKGY
jgi:hypothetical protein